MNCRKLSQLDGWEPSRLVWVASSQEEAPALASTAATTGQKEIKAEAKKETVVAKLVNQVALAMNETEDTKRAGEEHVTQAHEAIKAKSKAGAPSEAAETASEDAELNKFILKAGSVPEAKKSDIWESLEKLIAMLTALANKFIASLDKQLSKNEPKHFEKSPWGTGDKKFALDTPFRKGENNSCVTFKQMDEPTKTYAMESGTIKIEPETAAGDAPQTISIITDGGAKIEYFGLDPAKLKKGSPVKAGDEIGTTKKNVSLKLRLTNKDKIVVDPTALLAPYIKTETKPEAKK